MTAFYSVIIAVSYDNITLLRDSVIVSIFLISEALESVETGLSHLKQLSEHILNFVLFCFVFFFLS